MIFANEWRGARGRYLDYFLHFRGLESKRGNVKPSYLMEIHSEIGTLFHILVHHGPNTGEIVMKFAVYIVYNIANEWRGPEAVISTTSCTLRALKQTRNVKPSYLIEIHSEIGTLFYILVHHGCIYSLWYLPNGARSLWNLLGPEAVILTTSCTLGALKANAVMSNHRIW